MGGERKWWRIKGRVGGGNKGRRLGEERDGRRKELGRRVGWRKKRVVGSIGKGR